MHGFLCSDGKVQAMIGMTCKKCDNNNVEKNTDDRSKNSDMVLVEETEGNGNKVVNGEWNKIQHKKKPKNQIQNKKNNNKNKHRNQDAGKGQTGRGPTSIIRTGPNYQGGRGGRVDINQQHVRSTTIRFEEPKPLKPKPKPIQPEPERKDQIHQFKIKFNPWVMSKNGTNIQEIIEVMCKLIFTKTRNKAVFHPTAKIPLSPDSIEDI